MQKLLNASLAKICGIVFNPQKIPVILSAPPTLSTADGIRSLFPKLDQATVESCRLQLLKNNKFLTELNKNMVEKRQQQISCEENNIFIYMAVRFLKPQVVFETGVFDGKSSAAILQALDDNGSGILVSVDLPATETIKWSTHQMPKTTLPPGCQPGWLIPDYLRERHRLVLGDSKELLPQLLKEHPKIDIFIHDSLHTFKHQYFEYTTAWPHLSEGGLLLSDDIFWNPAFHKFSKEKNKKYISLGTFGALRK